MCTRVAIRKIAGVKIAVGDLVIQIHHPSRADNRNVICKCLRMRTKWLIAIGVFVEIVFPFREMALVEFEAAITYLHFLILESRVIGGI
jgi:hypothetical protein